MALIKTNNRSSNIPITGGRRNMIYNGAMQVSQRKAPTHTTTGMQNTGGIYTVDRFSYRRGGTWANAEFSHTRVDASGTGDAGLNKALQVKCTTAEGGAPPSGASVGIGYYFEKRDQHRIGVGSSAMVQTVLSFYAKSSIAGTFGLHILAYQHATTQEIEIPFTIDAANTWQRVSIVIPTYNTALDSDADNTNGWAMHIMLDGTAHTGTASTWDNYATQGLQLPNGVSTTTFSNTLNATFDITGVQLEEGTVATQFEHRTYAEDLRDCQRYYFHTYRDGIAIQSTGSDNGAVQCRNDSANATTNHHNFHLVFPEHMRATPQLTYYSLLGTVDRISFVGGDYSHDTNVSITGTIEMGERGIHGISVGAGDIALAGHVVANAEF